MKLRKFEVDNGKLVVSDKGEWIHENDVLLMLQNSRDEINGIAADVDKSMQKLS